MAPYLSSSISRWLPAVKRLFVYGVLSHAVQVAIAISSPSSNTMHALLQGLLAEVETASVPLLSSSTSSEISLSVVLNATASTSVSVRTSGSVPVKDELAASSMLGMSSLTPVLGSVTSPDNYPNSRLEDIFAQTNTALPLMPLSGTSTSPTDTSIPAAEQSFIDGFMKIVTGEGIQSWENDPASAIGGQYLGTGHIPGHGPVTSSRNQGWNSSLNDGDQCNMSTSSTTMCASGDISCINMLTPDVPATSFMTGGAKGCACGSCTIVYRQATILQWPVQRTNTWCTPYRSYADMSGMEYIGGHDDPYKTDVADSFINGAIKLNPEVGGTDAIGSDGRFKSQFTTTPTTGNYSTASDGFVFVSPSIYVVFPLLLATNYCGKVGNAYSSWTLGLPEGALSTGDGYRGDGYSAFNPADVGCPVAPQGYNLTLPISVQNGFDLDEILDQAEAPDPSVILPQGITDIDPAWKSCTIELYDLGRDPPSTMTPATNMVPKPTSVAIDPRTTDGAARPQSTPESPNAAPTRSSTFSENDHLSEGKNPASVPPTDPKRTRGSLDSAGSETVAPEPQSPGVSVMSSDRDPHQSLAQNPANDPQTGSIEHDTSGQEHPAASLSFTLLNGLPATLPPVDAPTPDNPLIVESSTSPTANFRFGTSGPQEANPNELSPGQLSMLYQALATTGNAAATLSVDDPISSDYPDKILSTGQLFAQAIPSFNGQAIPGAVPGAMIAPSAVPIIGDQPIVQNPNGDLILVGSTITPGAQATADGHVISNGGYQVILDGNTKLLWSPTNAAGTTTGGLGVPSAAGSTAGTDSDRNIPPNDDATRPSQSADVSTSRQLAHLILAPFGGPNDATSNSHGDGSPQQSNTNAAVQSGDSVPYSPPMYSAISSQETADIASMLADLSSARVLEVAAGQATAFISNAAGASAFEANIAVGVSIVNGQEFDGEAQNGARSTSVQQSDIANPTSLPTIILSAAPSQSPKSGGVPQHSSKEASHTSEAPAARCYKEPLSVWSALWMLLGLLPLLLRWVRDLARRGMVTENT